MITEVIKIKRDKEKYQKEVEELMEKYIKRANAHVSRQMINFTIDCWKILSKYFDLKQDD